MKTNLEKLAVAVLISSLGWISIGLIYATLQHLFIDHTYLFDTGYWIGLSAEVNPLLIEPSAINPGYSYFNTHFSPVFILLQITNNVLGATSGGLFYAAWFCLLGLAPLWIAGTWTLYKLNQNKLAKNTRIIFLLLIIFSTWAYASSNVWIQSFVGYPHTEIIGIQLVGAGWLLLSSSVNHQHQDTPRAKKMNAPESSGIALIVTGSLFHELIAVFGILALLSTALSWQESQDEHELRVLIGISLLIATALLSWVIFKHVGFFPGKQLSESALSRIYLGNPPLTHISFSTYIENITSLFANNLIPTAFLMTAVALSVYLKDKSCSLILISMSIYLLASPLAVSKSAATLGDHYGYPLALGYFTYVGLITKFISQDKQELKAGQDYSFSRFKIIPIQMARIPASLSIILAISAMFNSFNSAVRVLVPKTSNNSLSPIILQNKNLWYIIKRPGSVFELLKLSTQGSIALHRIIDTTLRHPSKKMLLADHRIAALIPNDIDYCGLIVPFRRKPNDPCSKLINQTSKNKFIFLTLQPKPGLDDDLVKRELAKLELQLEKRIPIGKLNGQEISINLYKTADWNFRDGKSGNK